MFFYPVFSPKYLSRSVTILKATFIIKRKKKEKNGRRGIFQRGENYDVTRVGGRGVFYVWWRHSSPPRTQPLTTAAAAAVRGLLGGLCAWGGEREGVRGWVTFSVQHIRRRTQFYVIKDRLLLKQTVCEPAILNMADLVHILFFNSIVILSLRTFLCLSYQYVIFK